MQFQVAICQWIAFAVVTIVLVEGFTRSSNRYTTRITKSLKVSSGRDFKLYSTPDDDIFDDSEDIEELFARAAREKDDKLRAEKEAAAEKKKDVLKRRKDKEYEAYWERVKGDSPENEAAVARAYYSLRKNETVGQKVAKYNNDRTLGGSTSSNVVIPVTGKELLFTGVSLGALFAGAIIAKRWDTIQKFASVSEATRPLDARTIRKDFTVDDMTKAVRKAVSQEGYTSLPTVPNSLATLPCLTGDSTILSNLVNVLGNTVTVIVFWRPTDLMSVRTVAAIQALANRINQNTNSYNNREAPRLLVAAVLAPKYPNEQGDTATIAATLLDSEVPENMFVDTRLDAWRDLGLVSWPTVLFCVNRAGTGGGSSSFASGKIAFVLEGQRSLAKVTGNTIAALAGVLLGGESNNAEAVARGWTSRPLLPPPLPASTSSAASSASSSVNRPTRMSFDVRSNLLYIADTGNHRVLEVSPTIDGTGTGTGTVLRIFGSPNGISGPASPGSSADKITFNRPMGVVADYEGFLYVADTGNDAIRRINLKDGTAVTVEVASADTDADGVAYDFEELQDLERLLGRNLKGMRDMMPDELLSSLKTKKLEDNPLASQILGRTRPLLLPTDVTVADAFVYASAAGSRQVWRVEGGGFTVRPVYGSGLLGRRDTNAASAALSFLGDKVRFAEPAGLVSSSGRLIVMDSDSNNVRTINLIEGYTRTVLGETSDDDRVLGGFGDVDTGGYKGRLQYPTGACLVDTDDILVADTLNNKIKLVTLDGTTNSQMKTIIGNGRRGRTILGRGKDVQLNAPQGVACDRNKKIAYIADTGNNRILVTDLKTLEVSELSLDFSKIRT